MWAGADKKGVIHNHVPLQPLSRRRHPRVYAGDGWMPVSVCVAHGRCVWSHVSKHFYAFKSAAISFLIQTAKIVLRSGKYVYIFSSSSELPCRTIDTQSYDDDVSETPALSRRSQAMGMILSLLLVGLSVCLLGLLLHKRERR